MGDEPVIVEREVDNPAYGDLEDFQQKVSGYRYTKGNALNRAAVLMSETRVWRGSSIAEDFEGELAEHSSNLPTRFDDLEDDIVARMNEVPPTITHRTGPSSTAQEDFEVFSSSLTTAMHDSSPDAGMTAVLERYLEPPIDRGMAWNRLAMIQHGNPPTEVLAGMYTRHPDDFGGLENLIDVRLL